MFEEALAAFWQEFGPGRKMVLSTVRAGGGVSSRMMSVARSEFTYGRAQTPEDIIRGFDAVTRESVLALAHDIFDFDSISLSAVGQVKDQDTYRKAL